MATGTRVAVLGVPVGDGHDQEDAQAFPLAWRADSSGLYASTDAGHEYSALVFVDRETGTSRTVLSEAGDVEDAVIDEGGTRLAVKFNDAGATSLRLFAIEDGVERQLPAPDLPLGVVESLSLHPGGGPLLLGLDEPRSATNLSIVDIDSGARTTVEQSMLGGLDPATLLAPRLITSPSFDRDVPAWLYRPVGTGPFPVVLSIHGGPESQERPTYGMLGLYQYLLSRGIGILAPNIRGSTGYGKSYQKLVHRDWGGGELRDIEAAAD